MNHIIALSGGKDSTAMALRLVEINVDTDFEFVITPTGNELPVMFEHWKRLECLLGCKLTVLMETSLDKLIKDSNALPNWRMRWCTRILKIEPFIAHAVKNSPCKIYVGLRADETSDKRKGAIYGDAVDVDQIYPLRDWNWGLVQVMQYLEKREVEIPERTDCAVCFYQTLAEWWRLWKYERVHWLKAVEYESMTGHTFRSDARDTWPAGLQELGSEFKQGRLPRGVSFQIDLFKERPSMCRACSM